MSGACDAYAAILFCFVASFEAALPNLFKAV